MNNTLVVWDEALLGYDLGDHPLNPVRVELTIALARTLGVLDRVEIAAPRAATDDELLTVHRPEYLAAVRAGAGYGLGTPDNPVFPRMHEASALVAGATLAAAEAVWRGDAPRAVSVAGGLHHAMPARASGFCVYNDPAIAIARLLSLGAQRVAYVDIDVHHGDGVQEIFYDDPRVLTVSLHETPLALFPGTGFARETGGPGAPGSAVNVALPPGCDDAGWLRAFHAVVPPMLRAFRPEILVAQCGADTYIRDPLADLRLTVDGQRAAQLALRDLADELCGGRWVATGGGGYALVECVPRAWTHLLAIAADAPVDPSTPTPAPWRDLAAERVPGATVPDRMTDGAPATWEPYDDRSRGAGRAEPDRSGSPRGAGPDGPAPDAVDRAIAATLAAHQQV